VGLDKDECWQRLERPPEVFEMIQGRLLLSDEGVENLLGLLLELAGAGCSAQCGNAIVQRAPRTR